MKTYLKLGAASMLALLVGAGAVMAQTTLTGIRDLNDRIDDLEDDIQEDIDRAEDNYRFGNPEQRQGLSGSASLGYSGTSGQNDSQDLSVGARLRYEQGQVVQTIGVVLEYSEVEGDSTQEDVFAVYDLNYYLNDRFYLFALGRVQSDGLADTAAEIKTDGFIGFGPGYRIVNTDQVSWRVQAGVGVSYLEDGLDDSDTDVGYILSSRLFYRVSDSFFVTNDTDVLYSDDALRVNNDLGANFQFSDRFVTRVSYLADYNEDRTTEYENKLGISLVYGF